MNVLFVDNYDSFTYNLVEYVSETRVPDGDGGIQPIDVTVLKNTASLDEIRAAKPDAILISPGPGHPKNARDVGVTMDVLRDVSPAVPTLGVCLGLEAAVYEYGGSVGHAPEPIHGKAYPVDHDERGVYEGLDQGFQAGRGSPTSTGTTCSLRGSRRPTTGPGSDSRSSNGSVGPTAGRFA